MPQNRVVSCCRGHTFRKAVCALAVSNVEVSIIEDAKRAGSAHNEYSRSRQRAHAGLTRLRGRAGSSARTFFAANAPGAEAHPDARGSFVPSESRWGMSFLWPEALVFLLVVPAFLFLYVRLERAKHTASMRYPGLHASSVPDAAQGVAIRHLPLVFFLRSPCWVWRSAARVPSFRCSA
jgi:hypothetical protein